MKKIIALYRRTNTGKANTLNLLIEFLLLYRIINKYDKIIIYET